ncbi:MAG: hypothetical protein HZB66_02870 [Candidatus Aenigmarchaeota archaeon]|nr:hypothetical protein [Candidatus Aenigmarchaeota archaeon]
MVTFDVFFIVIVIGLKSFFRTKIMEILIDLIKFFIPKFRKQLLSFLYIKLFRFGKLGKIVGIPATITVETIVGYYIVGNIPILKNITDYVISLIV